MQSWNYLNLNWRLEKMWDDTTLVIKSLYGMLPPDPKAVKLRDKKVKEIIEQMGDKYLLAKSVLKLN
jgi:hypothetical protein